MDMELVKRWDANKESIRKAFEEKRPGEYIDIIRAVVDAIGGEEYSDGPSLDPSRIHQIDDGYYQGTLVFVIAAKGYQPSEYWSVLVSYGSCSGCDTLQSIHNYSDEKPTDAEVDAYMTLALHVVQKLKKLGDYEDCV